MMRLALVAALALASLAPTTEAVAQSEPSTTRKPETRPSRKSTRKPAEEASSGPPGGATLSATFGDWAAYTATNGRSKICFAQSEPKSRSPASIKDTKAYLFVSFRPSENVRNEVASVLNFRTKDGGPASLSIGSTNYDLVTKGENAWVKNPSDEALAIGTMSKGGSMVVQTTSARGNKTSDRYSLAGFTQALERAKRDCL